MKRTLVALLALLGALGMAQRFSVEASAGYIYSGLGGQLAVVAEDLAPGLPLAVRLGLGFATSDGLNDSFDLGGGGGPTWGSIKESEYGQNITIALDALFNIPTQGLLPGQGSSVAAYLGLRYNLFEGGGTDSGGDTYKATANAFGVGGGLRLAFPLDRTLTLVADAGLDYFFQGCITFSGTGVGTTITACPGDSLYPDANSFATQPDGFVFRARLGGAFRF